MTFFCNFLQIHVLLLETNWNILQQINSDEKHKIMRFRNFYFLFEIHYHGQNFDLEMKKFSKKFQKIDKKLSKLWWNEIFTSKNHVWRLQPIDIRVRNIFADFVRFWRIECSRTYPLNVLKIVKKIDRSVLLKSKNGIFDGNPRDFRSKMFNNDLTF